MKEIEEKIQNFMEIYRTEILAAEGEAEYWNIVLLCLRKENFLEESDLDLIRKFLYEEENEIFVVKWEKTDREKENIVAELVKKYLESDWILYEKDHAVYETYYKEYWDYKKEHDLNEEKYIKRFFRDVRKYYVLCAMYKEKYELLWNTCEARRKYKKYGKSSVIPGYHYVHTPIMDLINSNVYRVGVTNKKPEDLSEKAEYDFDEEGRLIMYKAFKSDSCLYFCEFLLYAGDWILNIQYSAKEIELITLRRYKDELISGYEYAVIWPWNPFNGRSPGMHREIYQYSEKGILVYAEEEEYGFPEVAPLASEKNHPGYLMRTAVTFDSDEEDCIKAVRPQYFDGDCPKNQPGYVKLSERKRKNTKKTNGRWRRPNYFIR